MASGGDKLNKLERVIADRIQSEIARLQELSDWEKLGIPEGSDAAIVHKAFVQLSKSLHPDLFGAYTPFIRDLAHELFLLVGEAEKRLAPDGVAPAERKKVAPPPGPSAAGSGLKLDDVKIAHAAAKKEEEARLASVKPARATVPINSESEQPPASGGRPVATLPPRGAMPTPPTMSLSPTPDFEVATGAPTRPDGMFAPGQAPHQQGDSGQAAALPDDAEWTQLRTRTLVAERNLEELTYHRMVSERQIEEMTYRAEHAERRAAKYRQRVDHAEQRVAKYRQRIEHSDQRVGKYRQRAHVAEAQLREQAQRAHVASAQSQEMYAQLGHKEMQARDLENRSKDAEARGTTAENRARELETRLADLKSGGDLAAQVLGSQEQIAELKVQLAASASAATIATERAEQAELMMREFEGQMQQLSDQLEGERARQRESGSSSGGNGDPAAAGTDLDESDSADPGEKFQRSDLPLGTQAGPAS